MKEGRVESVRNGGGGGGLWDEEEGEKAFGMRKRVRELLG